MQNLGRVQLYPVFGEVLLSYPAADHLVLLLPSFQLQRVVLFKLLVKVDMDSAEDSGPFHNLVLGLAEDDLEGLFVDGVLAHGDEHLEGPGELLPVAEVVGPVFLEVLVESIEDGLEVNDLVVVVLCTALHR